MAIVWCEKCLGIIQSGGESAGGKICTCPPVFGPLKEYPAIPSFLNPIHPNTYGVCHSTNLGCLDCAKLQLSELRSQYGELRRENKEVLREYGKQERQIHDLEEELSIRARVIQERELQIENMKKIIGVPKGAFDRLQVEVDDQRRKVAQVSKLLEEFNRLNGELKKVSVGLADVLNGGYHQGDNGLVVGRRQADEAVKRYAQLAIDAVNDSLAAEKRKCAHCNDTGLVKAGLGFVKCGECEKTSCKHVFINYQCEKCGKAQQIENRFCEHKWNGDQVNPICKLCGILFYRGTTTK